MAIIVDHPFVDFIRVNDDMRRQGIGTALYQYGAKWLAREKGLPLYASGIQTTEAKAAWKFMRDPTRQMPVHDEPHPTKPGEMRTKLDYRKLTAALVDEFMGRLIRR